MWESRIDRTCGKRALRRVPLQNDSFQEIGKGASCWARVRYSGNIMHESDSPQVVHPITHVDAGLNQVDPVSLTRALCEIESTTYNEGAVGDFG